MKRYAYRDRHVHDIQEHAALKTARYPWRAEYDAALDVWHVWTPSGLYREYRPFGNRKA